MGINQKRKNLDSPSPVRTINRQQGRPPIPYDRKIENPGPVQNQPTANSADENESPIQSKLKILFVIGIFYQKIIIFNQNSAVLGWTLSIGCIIWASIVTSMIREPKLTQPSSENPSKNENESPIFEKICVKVASLDRIEPTVSLEARFQITYTMKAEEILAAICRLIRSNSIFSGKFLMVTVRY